MSGYWMVATLFHVSTAVYILCCVTISPTKPVINYNKKLVNPVRENMSTGKFVVSQSALNSKLT